MPKSKSRSRPRPGPPGQPKGGRSLRVRLSEEEYQQLRLIRTIGCALPSELVRHDLARHYEELVVPRLNGNGNGNGHTAKGKGCPKAGS
jgi:hypothetical protein